MNDYSISDIPGIRVGHAQDEEAGTGVTVVLCEEGVTAGVDVRGGGPGTRETDCLNPVNFIEKVHAICLSGGSAYGLDSASGVMQYLEEQGKGLPVGVGIVPIVPGAVLFDLPVGRPDIRPDKAMGYQACLNARGDNRAQGNVGAGTGASVGKTRGPFSVMKGGLGIAGRRLGDLIITAIVAVNCYGDVIDPRTGKIIAGTLEEDGINFADSMKVLCGDTIVNPLAGTNTTLGVVASNARLTKSQAAKVAQMSHDGFARAINPIHTMYDGDTIFCLATGEVEADITTLGSVAAEVMAEAIVNGVKAANSAYGLPGYKEIRLKQGA
jgi:L-aminopeptidase/D-esterase-like protein